MFVSNIWCFKSQKGSCDDLLVHILYICSYYVIINHAFFFFLVCRIHYDKKVGPEGEITSDMIPFADTSSPGYPVNKPIDCTWEIDAERHSKVSSL